MLGKLIDTFKQTADQIAFLDRGYGVGKSNVQSAIEKVYGEINRTNPTLEIVSVKDFGAVGDGETDDTQAFKTALAESLHVFVPVGDYVITDTLNVRFGQTLAGSNLRSRCRFKVRIDDPSKYAIVLGDGASISNFDLRTESGSEFEHKSNGVLIDRNSKWCSLQNIFVARFNVGFGVDFYYGALINCQAHHNNYGVHIGITGNTNVNIFGGHLRENKIANLFNEQSTDTNIFGTTFELGKTHIINQARLSCYNCYLSDAPSYGIINLDGELFIDNNSQSISGGNKDFLDDDEDVTENVQPSVITVTGGKCIISGGTLVTSSQGGSDPVDNQSLNVAVSGSGGKLILDNVILRIDNVKNFRPFAAKNVGYMLSSNPRTNYIIDGDLKNLRRLPYLTTKNVHNIVDFYKNPWGGSIVTMDRFGSLFKYSIPARLVGTEMTLLIVAGNRENITNGGFRVTNSDVTINEEKSYFSSKPSEDVYAPFRGRESNSEHLKSLGVAYLNVTPTKQFGSVNISFNSASSTEFVYELGGVFLYEGDEYLITDFVTPDLPIYGEDAPTTGEWLKNEVIYNLDPGADGPLYWICTESGSPGTWRAVGETTE